MAIPTWPVSLPQNPQKNFSVSGGVNILRTPVDKGPAKQRYQSRKPQVLKLVYLMSKTQVATFTFFVDNTLFGTQRFSLTHPITKSTVEVRIVSEGSGELYSINEIAPDYYNVSLTLEVLP
jgi:hypothetical protein